MPRTFQFDEDPFPIHDNCNMGDSLSHNPNLGVSPDKMWPSLLAVQLNGLGCKTKARNFARSGNTTTQMIARFGWMTAFGVPSLGIIFGGVNDPGSSITGATTQANLTTMVNRLLVAGCPRVIVVSTQYLNFSDGGDTPTVPYATYATLRTFQLAAVTAIANPNVIYFDLYAYMKSVVTNNPPGRNEVVVDGIKYTQSPNADSSPSPPAGFSWHYNSTDQHFNTVGHQVVANGLLAKIQAQSGWIAALSSPVIA